MTKDGEPISKKGLPSGKQPKLVDYMTTEDLNPDNDRATVEFPDGTRRGYITGDPEYKNLWSNWNTPTPIRSPNLGGRPVIIDDTPTPIRSPNLGGRPVIIDDTQYSDHGDIQKPYPLPPFGDFTIAPFQLPVDKSPRVERTYLKKGTPSRFDLDGDGILDERFNSFFGIPSNERRTHTPRIGTTRMTKGVKTRFDQNGDGILDANFAYMFGYGKPRRGRIGRTGVIGKKQSPSGSYSAFMDGFDF